MKIQAVVFELTDIAMQWLDVNGNEEHMDICEVITLGDDSPIPIWELVLYDNWDILLVFERGVRLQVESILVKSGIDLKRVIYPLDIEGSMVEHIDMAFYIFKEDMRRLLKYASYRREGNKYAMVSADGLSYVNASSDNVILPEMVKSGTNWARNEMELLFRLSNEHFRFEKKQDIFCDIGANIGTTCVYFKKKLDPDIKIIAFEPSPENYKLLKINFFLNDIDPNDHHIVPFGVSDEDSMGMVEYNPVNPGGTSVSRDSYGSGDEIRLIRFDRYIEENDIDVERIKYFWVDVEGFEARFLKGASDTLKRSNAPMFMEFIPKFYAERPDEFELLINELSSQYTSFICAQDRGSKKQPISVLRDKQNDMSLEWDLFLIK